MSTILCEYHVYSNRITLVRSHTRKMWTALIGEPIPFHQEEDSRNNSRFLCASETQNYILHARDFRVSHVTRSSIRSSKKLGDISREFLGIPPITLPISALTRLFLRFRENDIREKSDKMGNKKERDIYLALHDVVPLIPCNEKYRICLRNNSLGIIFLNLVSIVTCYAADLLPVERRDNFLTFTVTINIYFFLFYLLGTFN